MSGGNSLSNSLNLNGGCYSTMVTYCAIFYGVGPSETVFILFRSFCKSKHKINSMAK